MATEITTFCNLLFMNSNDFNVEETFAALLEYIKKYDRILYSEISLKIYNSYDDNTLEVAFIFWGLILINCTHLLKIFYNAFVRDRIIMSWSIVCINPRRLTMCYINQCRC